jgi:hypothetical protein
MNIIHFIKTLLLSVLMFTMFLAIDNAKEHYQSELLSSVELCAADTLDDTFLLQERVSTKIVVLSSDTLFATEQNTLKPYFDDPIQISSSIKNAIFTPPKA